MDYGTVIVNQPGHVRMTNQRAEQWLRSREIVQSLSGKIALTNATDNETIDKNGANRAAIDAINARRNVPVAIRQLKYR